MNQVATINRFCSIEGQYCQHSVPYKGQGTFFFAYPSANSWSAFSRHLADDMGSRGLKVERWEDTVSGDLIFRKVCHGILSNHYLLAEVTEPNTNVLMEVGYALAVGRQPILLVDESRHKWNRPTLSAVECCPYQNRDDILRFVERLPIHHGDDQPPPTKVAMLDSMGILSIPEEPSAIHHLKPAIATDWVKGITKNLNRHPTFSATHTDPSDSVTDDFYQQARLINKAHYTVASLLANHRTEWQENNAIMAILIGFAIGLGKRVLVLHEQPADPVLDLGSLSRPFDNEDQCDRSVRRWLTDQAQIATQRQIEQENQDETLRRRDTFASTYLGPPDALLDTKLHQYFVETPQFGSAKRKERSIFVGRRGTGKSANFKALEQHAKTQSDTVVVAIAPDDFEMQILAASLDAEDQAIHLDMAFQHAWHYILVTEMLKEIEPLLATTQIPRDTRQLRNYNRLKEYCDDNSGLLSKDFGNRLNLALETAKLDDYISSKGNPKEFEAIRTLKDHNIARTLRDFVTDQNLNLWVIADDLDKHWHPSSKQSITMLTSLAAESDRLQKLFSGRLNTTMFLREDIFDVLAKNDVDFQKRNYMRLEWTPDNLKHIVAERLAAGAGYTNTDDETTWADIFSESVEGIPAHDYLLERALLTPREVLRLCQATIDAAKRNGHNSVLSQDILEGTRSFSYDLITSVASEFRVLYPRLDEVILEFAEAPANMRWTTFSQYAQDAFAHHETAIQQWVGLDTLNPQAIARVLFQAGVIGLTAPTGEAHYRNGRSFDTIWRMARDQPKISIHPAFTYALDTQPSEAPLNAPQIFDQA